MNTETSVEAKALSQKKRRLILEFWLIVLIPWILDFMAKQRAFTSVFGASLWGICVGLSVARIKALDKKLLKTLGRYLVVMAVLWAWFFILSVFELSQTGISKPGLPGWLMLTHAGFLAAGAGMIFLNLISSCLWLYQNSVLKMPSMQRRELKFALPSLEALGKLTLGSVDLALMSWGAGFFLAVINGILKWSHAHSYFAWFSDPKVLVSAMLWLVLAVQFQLSHFLGRGNPKLFITHVALSVFFLICFVGILIFGNSSVLHEPITWFAR